MAQVHINNIVVENNPASVLDPFSFQITFESFSTLPGVFDWKIIYIGSPNNPDSDQIIESFDMDNISTGVMQFSVQSDPPNFNLIPQEEIIGTCFVMQAPRPSSFRSLTRSKSSSDAATTSGTSTMNPRASHQRT